MIRTTTLLASAGLLAGALSAQSMTERYQQKLEKEFVSNAAWVKSLDTAKSKAAKENKLIFGYFTRSYAP
jgi:ribosomal protein S17E